MLKIEKIITLSTAHITLETEKKLSKEPYTNNMQLAVYDKAEYGFFIFIPNNYNVNDNANIPNDLKKCMKIAIKNECNWLCLDCDGQEIEDLEKYIW